MTNEIPYYWTKRAGDRWMKPVRLLSEYGPFEVDFFSVEVFDPDGNNVTDELVDADYNSFSGNVVEIMFQGGEENIQYDVLIYVNSATTEEPIIRALLTCIP